VTLSSETHERITPVEHKVCGIVLDIEGTTTPIAFVHEVLFPYARARIRSFLVTHWGSTGISADLANLREQYAADTGQGLTPPRWTDGPRNVEIDSITEYVHWLIDQDRKSTGLKSLQGKIWEQCYLDGTLKAPLFADVLPALERWQHAGLKIGIFSSGSVLAQKLLFAHTEAGDVTPFINAYFDTTTGSKTSVDSYGKIASALRLPPAEVLFISDVIGELDAARTAGMQTLLCLRPGNPPQPPGVHKVIQSFDEISDISGT
jgi:enolase-phosphatase E1